MLTCPLMRSDSCLTLISCSAPQGNSASAPGTPITQTPRSADSVVITHLASSPIVQGSRCARTESSGAPRRIGRDPLSCRACRVVPGTGRGHRTSDRRARGAPPRSQAGSVTLSSSEIMTFAFNPYPYRPTNYPRWPRLRRPPQIVATHRPSQLCNHQRSISRGYVLLDKPWVLVPSTHSR